MGPGSRIRHLKTNEERSAAVAVTNQSPISSPNNNRMNLGASEDPDVEKDEAAKGHSNVNKLRRNDDSSRNDDGNSNKKLCAKVSPRKSAAKKPAEKSPLSVEPDAKIQKKIQMDSSQPEMVVRLLRPFVFAFFIITVV